MHFYIGTGLSLLLSIVFIYYQRKVPPGLPPGTFGFPILGLPCLPFVESRRKYFRGLQMKYGDIFSLQMFGLRMVVLSSARLIRESRRNPHIQCRPFVYTFCLCNRFLKLGVVLSEGELWLANRKFLARHLDGFGGFQTKLESAVNNNVKEWIDHLHQLCKGSEETVLHRIDYSINIAVFNVLFQSLASKKFKVDDPKIDELMKKIGDAVTVIQGTIVLLDVYPGLHRYVPDFVRRYMMKEHVLVDANDFLFDLFSSLIEEHKSSVDESNIRDFIDLYLTEAKCIENQNSEVFNVLNLMVIMHDLFVAGSETTATAMRWLILYLTIHQDVQQRLHHLIDHVVPRSRLPSLADRKNLAYLDAVLMETLRLASVFPLALHETTEDTTLAGYNIPKGMIVCSNIETCHRDPRHWTRPDSFYPEHFLDPHGNLLQRSAFIPFSTGRRVCPGEGLARSEFFMFAGALLHQFELLPPPGHDLRKHLNPVFGVVNAAPTFSITFKKRHTSVYDSISVNDEWLAETTAACQNAAVK